MLLPAVWGDAPGEKPRPAPPVEQLIQQLGDTDFRKRDEAGRQLEAMGPAILPALQKAQKHEDPEVRRRAAELMPSLELAALMAPKRVSLDIRRKPIRQVLDEVSRQTGYKIECFVNNEQQPFDFQIDNQPFWPALDQICTQSGLMLQQGYGDDRLRLHPQEGHVPFICYDGPVRLVANSIQHYRTIDFSFLPRTPQGTRRSDNLTLTFSLFLEPRMPLLGMGEVRLTAAYDDEKQSMVPLRPAEGVDPWAGRRWTSRYGNGYRSYTQQTQVSLLRPSEKAQSVKLIQGTIPVLLLADQKAEVVSDNILAAKGKKAKAGTASFAIEDVTETPNKQYQIKMTITEQAKEDPNDHTWINSLYQRIELQDAEGNKYQMSGNSFGGNGPNHANVTFTYSNPGNNAKLGPPAKLIYYNWSTLQHVVRFEFRDLPLP